MANTVFKLRRSSVAGKQPNTSTLAIGELALNLTDRKLYSSDGTNVWETGANLTNLSVSANATVNNLVITGGLFANGNDGSVGQVLTSNGTGVYWATSSGGGGGILDVRQQYTGDGVTNTFTVDGGYNSNSLSVYLNGVLLHNGTEANVINGETFSLSIPPANGALIDVIGISALYANGITTTVSQQFTANGTANSFTITGGYLPNKIQVFLNGVKQVPGTDVILTSGSTVNFTTTPANNYIVDVFGHQSDIIAHMYANQDLQYTWTNTHNFTNTVTLTSVSANGGYGTAGQALTTNGSSVYWSTIVGTNTAAQYVWTNTHTFNANVNVNAALIANGTAGIDSQVLTTNGSGIYWSSAGVNTAAQYIWSNTQTFSNTITFSSIIVGTANNASYLGGTPAASYALSSSLSSYQTTAGLSANVATLTSNNATYAFGKSEGEINANSALTANNASNLGGTAAASYALTSSLSSYQTTAGLSANVATLTSNNATYVFGKTEGNLNVNNSLTSNTANNVGGRFGYEFSWGHDFSHGNFTDFNTFINTKYFGAHFIQGTTNGPGHSGAGQYYHQRMSLGGNYDNYSMQLAIPRNMTDSYLYYRNEEGGSASSWYKIRSGYADSAGSVSSVSASALPAGSVIQVQTTTLTTPFATSTTGSFVDITGMSVAITPTSSSNKILVLVSGEAMGYSGTTGWGVKLVRNSTDICVGTSVSNRRPTSSMGPSPDNNWAMPFSINFLDSPATTSSITYKLQGWVGTSSFVFNRSQSDSDSSGYLRSASTITVMEIKA